MAKRTHSPHLGARRILEIGTLASTLVVVSCSRNQEPKAPAVELHAAHDHQADAPALEASTPGPVATSDRNVGDVVVHRFSGSFSKNALILREEIVELGDDTFTVHYTLDEGASQSELLVTRANRSERIISVARLDSGRETPASVSDYEAMIEKTLFAPDQNQGQVAKRSQTCLVGTKEHDCEIAEYKVYVADQEARLSVARSPELDRDVSGEVVAVDGTMIYRAELLEVQEQEESSATHNREVAVIDSLE